MSVVARAFWNPIVAKEYLSRMRTWRSPVAMMVYILLIGGLGWAIFAAMTSSAFGPFGFGQSGTYGQTLFVALVVFQMVLLAFITPALTAGAISGERERQTIDLLFVTRISPFSILWGKLLASMSFVLLLLVLSVPIFSLVFLFGGIELDQVMYAFLVTGVTALTLGVVGIAFSTLLRRTLPATVAAYGTAFVLLVGTFIYGLLFPTTIDPQSTTTPAPPAITFLSPFLPLMTIANEPINGYGVRYTVTQNGAPQGCYPVPGGGFACSGTGVSVAGGKSYGPQVSLQAGPGTIPSGLFAGWQYWQANIVMQLVICLVALSLSALILPPVRRLRWRRRPQPTPAVT